MTDIDTTEAFDEFVIEGAPAIDPGTYPATLTNLSKKTFQADGEERTIVIWEFGIEVDGQGQTIEGVTSKATGPKSKAFGWLVALLGATKVTTGDRFRRSDLIGRECLVEVGPDPKSGWPKVHDVMAPIRK